MTATALESCDRRILVRGQVLPSVIFVLPSIHPYFSLLYSLFPSFNPCFSSIHPSFSLSFHPSFFLFLLHFSSHPSFFQLFFIHPSSIFPLPSFFIPSLYPFILPFIHPFFFLLPSLHTSLLIFLFRSPLI